MPLFKEKKYSVKGKDDVKIRFNVDDDGKFWCSVNPEMAQATGLQLKEFADSFKELDDRIINAIMSWIDIETVCTYFIKYRLALSTAVRRKLPDELTDREGIWKKTSRIGSEYFPDDQTCMIFDWEPIVRETRGTIVREEMLMLATDETFHMRQALEAIEKGETPHSLHTGSLYKPFESVGDDTIFETNGNYWQDNDEYKFVIPLTLETWQFFNNVDDTFLKLFNGMLGFLSEDPKLLMSNISKVIESGNMNLLTFKQNG